MGRRRRMRAPSRARKHPVLFLLVLLGVVALAGHLLDHPPLLAAAGLAAGSLLLLKLAIWHHRRQRRLTATRSLERLLALSPTEFEEAIAALLRRRGYRQVRRIGGPGDRGVDLVGRDAKGRSVVVQCKRYAPRHHIGSPVIQSFIGMIVQHNAERGLFVTTSGFTRPAIDLARDAPVPLTLLDGPALIGLATSTSRHELDADLAAERLPQSTARVVSPSTRARRTAAGLPRAAASTTVSLQPCPSCGHQIHAGDHFCAACGQILESATRDGRTPRRSEAIPANLPPAADGAEQPWQ